jgi:hypothetical protein
MQKCLQKYLNAILLLEINLKKFVICLLFFEVLLNFVDEHIY